MKKINILILIIVFVSCLFSQTPPDTLWTKTYGDSYDNIARSLITTDDGCYVFTGTTGPSETTDVQLYKTDSYGNIIWESTFGGNNKNDGFCVIQTLDNGYLIVGQTNSGPPNFYDAYIIKTDMNGVLVWEKTHGSTGSDIATSVLQLQDGSYIVSGSSTSYGAGYYDAWLFKLDESENMLWQQTYSGLSNDNGTYVTKANDEGFVISGYREFFDNWDMLVIKTDDTGNMIWENTFDQNDRDGGLFIMSIPAGYFVIGSTFSEDYLIYDTMILTIDEDGEVIWLNTYGYEDYDWAQSAVQDESGNFIITGFTKSFGNGLEDIWLFKIDGTGDIIWESSYGGSASDFASSIQKVDDGFVVAGTTESFGSGAKDSYLIRLGSEGQSEVIDLIPKIEDYNLRNFPNPFNPTTEISFNLTTEITENTEIQIFNSKGQKVKTISNLQITQSLNQQIMWNGTDSSGKSCPSGVYLYKLVSGDKVLAANKMLLLK